MHPQESNLSGQEMKQARAPAAPPSTSHTKSTMPFFGRFSEASHMPPRAPCHSKGTLRGSLVPLETHSGTSHGFPNLTMILPRPVLPQFQPLAPLTIWTLHWSPEGRVHTDHGRAHPARDLGAWRSRGPTHSSSGSQSTRKAGVQPAATAWLSY